MTRRHTSYRQPATPRVIESGEGWTVCFDPTTRDYSAYIEGEYVGSRDTPTEARTLATAELLAHYEITHTPEKAAALIMETL